MPTDNPFLCIFPTYGPCNVVVYLELFLTERVKGTIIKSLLCRLKKLSSILYLLFFFLESIE